MIETLPQVRFAKTCGRGGNEKGADPLGQLLIAMIKAQNLNDSDNKPIYGCYTIGRLWFFIILEDKKYAVSRAYDATQIDDLGDMVVILKKVKQFIHKDLGLPIDEEYS